MKRQGLLGNKKRKLSLKKEEKGKRSGGVFPKKEEIIFSYYSLLERETVEKRK